LDFPLTATNGIAQKERENMHTTRTQKVQSLSDYT
jgi:hypothetical protein